MFCKLKLHKENLKRIHDEKTTSSWSGTWLSPVEWLAPENFTSVKNHEETNWSGVQITQSPPLHFYSSGFKRAFPPNILRLSIISFTCKAPNIQLKIPCEERGWNKPLIGVLIFSRVLPKLSEKGAIPYIDPVGEPEYRAYVAGVEISFTTL